jgi:hypothetical protein
LYQPCAIPDSLASYVTDEPFELTVSEFFQSHPPEQEPEVLAAIAVPIPCLVTVTVAASMATARSIAMAKIVHCLIGRLRRIRACI